MCLMMNTFSRQNEYMRLVNAFILMTHFIQWITISNHHWILYTHIKWSDISAIDISNLHVQRLEMIAVLLSTNHPLKMS